MLQKGRKNRPVLFLKLDREAERLATLSQNPFYTAQTAIFLLGRSYIASEMLDSYHRKLLLLTDRRYLPRPEVNQAAQD